MLRRIGGWVPGKARLVTGLHETRAWGLTAAQIFLTPAHKAVIFAPEDGVDTVGLQSIAEHVQLFVHAPYVMSLFPPLVKHSRQLAPLRMLATHAASIGAVGLVLHLGEIDEYGETAVVAARQMIEDLPIRIFIENSTHAALKTVVEFIVRLRDSGTDVALCLDTARAWVAGDAALFGDARAFDTLVNTYLTPALGLFHLNNSTQPFNVKTHQGLYAPLLFGSIGTEWFERVLKVFPQTPVILERASPVQMVVDRAVVTAIDCDLTHTLFALKNHPISGSLSQS